MSTMNQEVKGLWLTALRDGKRKQGRGRLKNTDGTLCCLGVLCDIYLESKGLKWDEGAQRGAISGMEWALPSSVVEWADLPVRSPAVIFEGCATHLINLNDRHCLSFDQLADLIEAQL